MFECTTCGRSLTSDSNYCDVCGSLQPRQPTISEQPPSTPSTIQGSLIDVAYDAVAMLVQIWNNIPETEKVAVTSAITTYLLTKSTDTFMYLREWHDRKKNEFSPIDVTSCD